MMKGVFSVLLVMLCITTANAQQPQAPPEAQSYKAGGVPIVIPAPTGEMREVGYDNREFMEFFTVAEGNRLLAKFVLAEDLERLTRRDEDLVLSRFAAVQVPRRGEYMDVDDDMFQQVIKATTEQMKTATTSTLKEAEAEINRRMQSLDLDDLKTSFGQPILLGSLFQKNRAYGYGMIIPVTAGSETTNMCVGATLVLVKKRMLFVYLYAEYENEDSVIWIRRVAEAWADAILAANPL